MYQQYVPVSMNLIIICVRLIEQLLRRFCAPAFFIYFFPCLGIAGSPCLATALDNNSLQIKW